MVKENKGDGSEKGGDKVRFCPLLNKYCLKERCAFHIELTKYVGELQQRVEVCAVKAIVVILSEGKNGRRK